jgi:hypothetical protein
MATRNGVRSVVTIEGESLNASGGANGAVASIAARSVIARAQGTGSGQVDKVFSASTTVGTLATDYDLSGGSNVKDPASQADQTFTKLHGILVENKHATQTITVGGDANSVPIFGDPADTVTIGPGGCFLLDYGGDGYAVTAGTGDILQVVGSGASTAYQITIWGR